VLRLAPFTEREIRTAVNATVPLIETAPTKVPPPASGRFPESSKERSVSQGPANQYSHRAGTTAPVIAYVNFRFLKRPRVPGGPGRVAELPKSPQKHNSGSPQGDPPFFVTHSLAQSIEQQIRSARLGVNQDKATSGPTTRYSCNAPYTKGLRRAKSSVNASKNVQPTENLFNFVKIFPPRGY